MKGAERSFGLLDKWIESNGWSGYDPYDFIEVGLFRLLQKNRYSRVIADPFLDRYPMFLRKALRVRKHINSKAMALFARAYLRIYKKRKHDSHLQRALTCLKWLEENPSKGFSGFCWGYPYDWQTRVFIPRETPCIVPTSIAAHAFLDAYETLEDERYLRIAESVCNFLLQDLNIDYVDKDRLCFSYTPVDRFHVHNANLFAASALLRTSSYKEEKQYIAAGAKAINFTVSYQNNDGSWYYWAPPDKVDPVIDNFHTGFVLECLNMCRRTLREEFEYKDELRNGLEFYARNLFLEGVIPKMRHNSVYPIDIHSCAQGIITFCELQDFDGRYLHIAENVARWTIKRMQNERGYFYYRVYRTHVDKTPFIRWGEAWMMRALSYIS